MARFRLETEFPAFKGEKDLRRRVLRATESTAKLAISFLNKTTATWDHRVKFTASKRGGGGALGVRQTAGFAFIEVTTSDEIWHQLDQGTDFKLVRVSGDWEPKTMPGVFDSFAGAGEVVFDGVPRAGIVARRWTEELPNLIADDFADNVFNSMVGWP